MHERKRRASSSMHRRVIQFILNVINFICETKDSYFWIDHIRLRICSYSRNLYKISLADVENDVFNGMRAQGLWYIISFLKKHAVHHHQYCDTTDDLDDIFMTVQFTFKTMLNEQFIFMPLLSILKDVKTVCNISPFCLINANPSYI